MSDQTTPLDLACQYLEIDPAAVVKSREEDGDLVVIANLGIKGTKKFRVPVATLAETAPKPKSKSLKGGKDADGKSDKGLDDKDGKGDGKG